MAPRSSHILEHASWLVESWFAATIKREGHKEGQDFIGYYFGSPSISSLSHPGNEMAFRLGAGMRALECVHEKKKRSHRRWPLVSNSSSPQVSTFLLEAPTSSDSSIHSEGWWNCHRGKRTQKEGDSSQCDLVPRCSWRANVRGSKWSPGVPVQVLISWHCDPGLATSPLLSLFSHLWTDDDTLPF